MLMPTENKHVVPSEVEGKPLPIAPFKNSLRAWLARWKAERSNQAPVLEQLTPSNAAQPAIQSQADHQGEINDLAKYLKSQ